MKPTNTKLNEGQYAVLARAAHRTLDNIQGWEGTTVRRSDVIEVVVDQIESLGAPHGARSVHDAMWPEIRSWMTANSGNAEFKRVFNGIFPYRTYSF